MANSKELGKKLAQLDRRWEEEQQAYMLAGRLDSAPQLATRTKAIVGGVLVGGMGAFWGIMAATMIPGDGFFANVFPWFGLLFVGAGLYQIVTGVIKAGKYERGLSRYKQRRHQLI